MRAYNVEHPCGHTNKRDRLPCKRPVMHGSTACHQHGGATPKGLASPSIKHGRYSKAFSGSLASKYELERHDPEYISIQDEMASLTAMIQDATESLGNAGSIETWRNLHTAYINATTSLEVLQSSIEDDSSKEDIINNTRTHASTIHYMGSLINGYLEQRSTLRELRQMYQERAKLSEREQKRKEALETSMSPQQATLFMTTVFSVVARYITDAPTQVAIGQELDRIYGYTPSS